MIYTITFNPALDYIMVVPSCRSGEVNRTESEKIMAGGKGINVSIVLNNMGVENTALGFISGFTGGAIENILADMNCKTDFIKLDNGFSRINVKIKSDAETEINGQGPVSYTHLRAHETGRNRVCRLLLEKNLFLMIRRPPRSTPIKSSAASDVYKRQPARASLRLRRSSG